MRRPGREVPARARGDPAAERRELERLREEAHRQPVLGELLLEPRPGRARLDARRARDRVDLEHAVQPRRGRRDDRALVAGPARGSTPPTTLVPPPYGRHRHAARRAHHSSTRSEVVLVAGRARRRPARAGTAPRNAAHDVRVGAPRARAARASWSSACSRAQRRRGTGTRAGSASAERRRRLELGRAEAEVRGEAGRGLAQLAGRTAARPRSPSPSACAAPSAQYASRGRVSFDPGILARGPWPAGQVAARWRDEPYEPAPERTRRRRRGDRRAARPRLARPTTASPRASPASSAPTDGLRMELQPMRWALRLVASDASASLAALCVVRDGDGPLARRPPRRRGSRPGPGAGRSAPAARSRSARTRRRRSRASWTRSGRSSPSARPSRRSSASPTGWSCSSARRGCAPGAEVTRDPEHDAHAWWPPDLDDWPDEADRALRHMARLLERVITFTRPASTCRSPTRRSTSRCSALAVRRPTPATTVFGWAHGLGWIAMSLLCLAAVRRRVHPAVARRDGRGRGRPRAVRGQRWVSSCKNARQRRQELRLERGMV